MCFVLQGSVILTQGASDISCAQIDVLSNVCS